MGEECLQELFEGYLQTVPDKAEELQADDRTVAAFLDFVSDQQQLPSGQAED